MVISANCLNPHHFRTPFLLLSISHQDSPRSRASICVSPIATSVAEVQFCLLGRTECRFPQERFCDPPDTLVTALKSIARSLSTSFDQAVEIVTDAPQYDWEFFYKLAYDDGHWPRIVRNFPTDATTLSQISEGEELPHHALLDARIIADMFAPVCGGSGLS